MAVVASYSANW